MTSKASNFSDLIQRVAASCLLHPLAASRHENRAGDEEDGSESESESEAEFKSEEEEEEAAAEEKEKYKEWWEGTKEEARIEKMMEMERVMKEVFEAVSSMKRAYSTLQQAHCPWDPEKIRVADVAVVGELKRLAVLRERFRRSSYNGSRGGRSGGVVGVREVVAPYEAAVEELKKEVKVRSVEVENLKEKLRNAATLTTTSTVTTGKKGRSRSHALSKNKLSSTLQPQGQALKLYPNVFFSLLTFYQFYYDTSLCWVVFTFYSYTPSFHTAHFIVLLVNKMLKLMAILLLSDITINATSARCALII